MEEREIDLLDMITDILSHWRGLLAALIVGAVLMGGFSYVKSYQNVQNADSLEQLEAMLPMQELQAVQVLLEQEKAYAQQKSYLDHSVSMQLDPEQIAQRDLIYNIKMKDPEQGCLLTQLYVDLINSTAMYQWIEEKTGIAANVAGELVYTDAEQTGAVTDIVKSNEKVRVQYLQESADTVKNNVKIIVRYTQESGCDQLAEAVKEYMTEQQKVLEQKVEIHQLILISDTGATVADTNLKNNQRSNVNGLADLSYEIGKAKQDFTDEQWEYYNLLVRKENEAVEAEPEDATIEQLTTSHSISKKYVLLGAVLFAFVYVGILFLRYIFNSKIRVSDELQRLYHIPQIGTVVKDSGKKFIVDKWVDDLRHYGKRKFSAEQSVELAFAAVKIAAVKNGLNSICLMGCSLSAGADVVCESLKAALEKEGITVTVLDNLLHNAEVMEKVESMAGVVLVEKAGSTLYNEIASELALLKRQEITVLGGIIVE